MFKKKFLSVLMSCMMVVSLLPSAIAPQQTKAASTWRSVLYPENWTPGYTNSSGQFLHDFSYAGYERGEKDIPTQMSGLHANVVDYGADATGANDSTGAIQSAINAVEAAGGGTVYLPEGTFKVKPTSSENSAALRVKGSNILFKGAGVGKTFIRCYAENMRFCQVINISPNSGTWNSADDGKTYYLSQDIPSTPTTTIHVNDVSNFKAGDWVIIRSDRTADWINEHSMSGFWSASVNTTTMGTTFYRKITGVNTSAKTVEIDIPTRYYMKTRDNARIYKVSPKQTNVGLCDFSIGNKANSNGNGWGKEDYKTSGNGSYNVNNAFLIKFSLNVNCFAKNISTYQAGNASQTHMSSNGLDINQTRNLTVENCDFSYPQYEGGGGNGYGMNVCGQETLIKNCSSTSARHSFAFKYSYASGNVVYHYKSTDPKYGSDFHMYLSMSNLIDNEELNGDFVETNVRPYGGTAGNRHGYTSTQTVFWNTKGNYYKSGTNYIIDSRQFGYGYIIGTQGAATAVKTTPTTMSSQYGTVNTAPEDYKEGIGSGSTLSPQSLYYDQLERRLNGKSSETVTAKDIPGTIPVNSYSDKSSAITMNTDNNVTYAGNLNDGLYLSYMVSVAKAGDYTINLKLAAGEAQYNAKNMIVKLDGNTIATIPVQASSAWTTFVDHSAKINLSQTGKHTLTIMAEGGACNVADFSVENYKEETTVAPTEAPTTAPKKAGIEINGYQISTTVKGHRVVYSVFDPNKEIVSSGLVYGVANYATAEDMVVGSSSKGVMNYQSTDIGKCSVAYSDMEDAQSYTMTMQFVDSVKYYSDKFMVRAYAQLKDGTYVYSDVENYTIYSIADILYQNRKMNTVAGHNFLYEKILLPVNPVYKIVDYDWGNIIVGA
ncbi:MAG: carbohydrate-binding protein [Eubacterium sp.]